MGAKHLSKTMDEVHAEDRRHRLALALERLGISAKEASLKAGLNQGYVSDFLEARSHSKDQNLKVLCDAIGVRWEWFDVQISESEPMLKSEILTFPAVAALDPKRRREYEMFLFILESVVGYLSPNMPEQEAKAFASVLRAILIDILDEPQEGGRDEERIRTVVRGVLRSILDKRKIP